MTHEEKKEYARQYRKDHPDKIRQYRKDHVDEIRQQQKKYYKDHPDKIKQYYENGADKKKQYIKTHVDEIRRRQKQYYQDHTPEINKRRKQYYKDHLDKIRQYYKLRRQKDPEYKLCGCLRTRLYCALKSNSKVGSAVRDLGCSIADLKKYLELKFQVGMTWDNYGIHGWHLDHVIPLAKFNLQDRQQFLIANNYTNLQPMWTKENIMKRDLSVEDFRGGMF